MLRHATGFKLAYVAAHSQMAIFAMRILEDGPHDTFDVALLLVGRKQRGCTLDEAQEVVRVLVKRLEPAGAELLRVDFYHGPLQRGALSTPCPPATDHIAFC
jgi:hypothetical protein